MIHSASISAEPISARSIRLPDKTPFSLIADTAALIWATLHRLRALVQLHPLGFRRLRHPVTADHRREIDIRVLAKAGAFQRPMRFPFQHLESAPDHIKVFRVGDKSRQTPQIVAVQWRPMTFGLTLKLAIF